MRLSALRDQYLPWRKADTLVGSVLYWIPVAGFPCRTAEKVWLRQFLMVFDQALKVELKCRVEVFVHRDAIYPDMTEPMLLNLQELNPVPGIMRAYGDPLRKAPSPRDVVRMVAEGKQESLLSLGTDIGWWFARKNADKQRDLFLGLGGMVNVWLPPDPETKPPSFRLPEKLLKNAAFAGMDVAGAVAVTYSFADSFLPKSLKTWAPEVTSDAQYQGYPFSLALFRSRDILGAGGETREEWLKLAPCYLMESPRDGGTLLWGRPEIEGLLEQSLEVLRAQKVDYPMQ